MKINILISALFCVSIYAALLTGYYLGIQQDDKYFADRIEAVVP